MGKSSIYQPDGMLRGAWASELGARIRSRRLALGLTQTELGAPFTKSYVSAIEHGRAVPSLRALWVLSGRLGVGVGDLTSSVYPKSTGLYTPAHGHQTDTFGWTIPDRDASQAARRRRS